MKNGDIVLVHGLFNKSDSIECKIVGVAGRDITSGKIYCYIVQPIVKIGDWNCYTAMRGTITLK